jgi:hypothetical protein
LEGQLHQGIVNEEIIDHIWSIDVDRWKI